MRKSKSLTQEELAFDAGLDRTYISLLELGHRSPTLDSMLALSRALNVPLASIASQVEERLESSKDGKHHTP
jgi:transcriptional regulator with XRE-family HTH domain